MQRAVRPESLFDALPADPGTERFDILLRTGAVTLERIVSSGSQPRQSYCQTHDEWVVLLRGRAEMLVGDSRVILEQGQFLFLPANTSHELVSTSENALWLALHLHAAAPEDASRNSPVTLGSP